MNTKIDVGGLGNVIMDNVREKITVIDRDHNIVYSNRPEGENIWWDIGRKCSGKAKGGKHICAGPCCKYYPDECFEKGEVTSSIHTHITSDSREYRIQVTHIPVMDSDARVAFVIETMTDITEKREVEEKIRDIEVIIEQAEGAIFIKDLDGIIRSWTEGAGKMYGYRPEEIIGKSVGVLVPEDLRVELFNLIQMTFQGKRVEHFQTFRVTKDKKVIKVDLTLSPVRDETGSISGIASIAFDISDKKTREWSMDSQRLRGLQDELLGRDS